MTTVMTLLTLLLLGGLGLVAARESRRRSDLVSAAIQSVNEATESSSALLRHAQGIAGDLDAVLQATANSTQSRTSRAGVRVSSVGSSMAETWRGAAPAATRRVIEPMFGRPSHDPAERWAGIQATHTTKFYSGSLELLGSTETYLWSPELVRGLARWSEHHIQTPSASKVILRDDDAVEDDYNEFLRRLLTVQKAHAAALRR